MKLTKRRKEKKLCLLSSISESLSFLNCSLSAFISVPLCLFLHEFLSGIATTLYFASSSAWPGHVWGRCTAQCWSWLWVLGGALVGHLSELMGTEDTTPPWCVCLQLVTVQRWEHDGSLQPGHLLWAHSDAHSRWAGSGVLSSPCQWGHQNHHHQPWGHLPQPQRAGRTCLWEVHDWRGGVLVRSRGRTSSRAERSKIGSPHWGLSSCAADWEWSCDKMQGFGWIRDKQNWFQLRECKIRALGIRSLRGWVVKRALRKFRSNIQGSWAQCWDGFGSVQMQCAFLPLFLANVTSKICRIWGWNAKDHCEWVGDFTCYHLFLFCQIWVTCTSNGTWSSGLEHCGGARVCRTQSSLEVCCDFVGLRYLF